MDAYRLGFAKCMGKVAQAFLELDLSVIIDLEPKKEEEEEKEGEAINGATETGRASQC